MPVTEKIVKCERRVVAIAGPVHQEFSRICEALEKNQQVEVTAMVRVWNHRHRRRAEIRLRQKAESLAQPSVSASCRAE